jgi:hypothetical protein
MESLRAELEEAQLVEENKSRVVEVAMGTEELTTIGDGRSSPPPLN